MQEEKWMTTNICEGMETIIYVMGQIIRRSCANRFSRTNQRRKPIKSNRKAPTVTQQILKLNLKGNQL